MNKIGTWKFKEKYVDCKISLLDSVNFFFKCKKVQHEFKIKPKW